MSGTFTATQLPYAFAYWMRLNQINVYVCVQLSEHSTEKTRREKVSTYTTTHSISFPTT